MDKRQDAQHNLAAAILLTVSLFFVLLTSACQTNPNPAPSVSDPPRSTPPLATTPEVTVAANTPTAPIPEASPTPACAIQGGTRLSESLLSEQLGEELHFQVYLPPCYEADPARRYPVAYLLHGLSFNEDQWLRLGVAETMDRLIAEEDLPPFIIILPREARFQSPPNAAFPAALTNELIPWVDQHYRTQSERSQRAIGGLSRGAAWAVHLGFNHPELFSSVGAHSLPLFEFDGGRLTAWLAHHSAQDLPAFFIDIGRADPERSSAQAFADQLDENNMPHSWYLFNGGHTEDYWSAHLELYLRWYGRNW